MKKFVLASLLSVTALAGTAIATQVAPTAPPPSAQKMQRMAPPATSAEMIERADRMFARMDANNDGQVTQAERTAMREAVAERREARAKRWAMKKGGRGGERMLARVDANKDGNISREEFRAQASQRFAKLDTNADGRVDATEQAAVKAKRGERRAKMAERRAARAGQAAPVAPSN
ncbi:EF-hand domain-containing protein [Sphingomonas qomolangmaensis]|uniref:EF-hand domain-containing protein n=1 Tax=Sphingomonas qomolangmaensis TaxID=2918765 RepID=A0ABY5L9P6_9SPHN|nr:hypothetical protein [Sphingomonas qomolangmaensis]UUL83694.1 hypothetical protein NMP03_05685 [Sphingomonas qomolangmaensis]